VALQLLVDDIQLPQNYLQARQNPVEPEKRVHGEKEVRERTLRGTIDRRGDEF
jgi:hypothetical protein